MPAPSNTHQRRAQISAALARVMARSGYDGASVATIAADAGVATGGVHYHFKSKQEILVDLIERLVHTAETRVEARVQQAGTARAQLAAILDGLLLQDDDADPDAVAVWALVGAEAVRNEEVRELYARWIGVARDRLQAAFAAACRAEKRSATGAKRAATALVTFVEGSYAVAAGAPGVIAPGSAAPAARQIADALLDAQPRQRR